MQRLDPTTQSIMRSRVRKSQARLIPALWSIAGIAAVTSIAGWATQSFVRGSLPVGTITGIDTSSDGATWGAHPNVSSALALSIALPASATFLSPGDTSYSALSVRAAAGTNVAVPIAVSTNVTAGTATGLTYQLLTTSTFGCSSTTTGTSVIPSGTDVAGSSVSNALTLRPGTSSAAGPATNLCLKITAGSDATSVSLPTIDWILTGGWTSTSTPTP
ncbi:MAG: hypothetical protein ACKOXM_00565 [Agromyces sp.]